MVYADDNVLVPYKDRKLDIKHPIRLYRNLNKKGVWYSLIQHGKTVAHTSAICLKDCLFFVNEKTRQRVISTKKKEFHAFIEGYYTGSGMGTTAKKNDLPAEIKYDPYKNDWFTCSNLTSEPFQVLMARFVICNHEGVKAAYTVNKNKK